MADVTGRHDLTDAAWAAVGPLLPVAARGRPARNLRAVVEPVPRPRPTPDRVRGGLGGYDVERLDPVTGQDDTIIAADLTTIATDVLNWITQR